MAHDVLQRFLTARLFDVGGEDARFEKLRETASDVTKVIQAAPYRAAAFTIVAIDGDVSPDEPIVAEVISLLEKRWNSYAGAFADNTLRVVARAIILDALAQLVTSDEIALAITLTARNFLPHVGSLVDRSLWSDVLIDAENRLEDRARREWALPSASNFIGAELVLPEIQKVSSANVSRDWLRPKLEAAVGPTDQKGVSIPDSNPQWTNAAPAWSYEFAPRATTAIADAIDAVAKRVVENINAAAPYEAVVTAVTNFVTQSATNLAQMGSGLEKRTSLLWWKEALYSPGANISYRDLDVVTAAAWAAVDALDYSGAYSPRMAEAFLKETVRSISPATQSPPQQLSEIVRVLGLSTEASSVELRRRLSHITAEQGRTMLASLLDGNTDQKDASARLGLPADFALSPVDLSLWLYRDLQVAYATTTPTKPKRKAKAA